MLGQALQLSHEVVIAVSISFMPERVYQQTTRSILVLAMLPSLDFLSDLLSFLACLGHQVLISSGAFGIGSSRFELLRMRRYVYLF